MVYYNSKNQRLMIAIDWLQWSGYLIGEGVNSLPELECPNGYRLEVHEGNNIFKYRAILYDSYGQKVLTMLWCPKSPMMQYNLITFQVSNMWFYGLDPIKDVCDLASQCFMYQFGCLSRLDICCDFELNKKRRGIVIGLYKHNIICGGKREASLFESSVDGDMFPKDFNFGSVQSAIRWKLYNKSLELKVDTDNYSKPYIVDRWAENDMNIRKIWRLEVSIKEFGKIMIDDMKTGNKKYMTLNDLDDVTIYCLFCDLYNKRFVLLKHKHTRRANDERVYLIELESHKIISRKPNSESQRLDNSVMWHLIKVCESDGCKANARTLQASGEALFWFVKFNNLDGYFERLKGCGVSEWIENLIKDNGEGIIDYLPTTRS